MKRSSLKAGPKSARREAEELGFRPSRGRGQNFLRDDGVARRIVEFSQVGAKHTVLEIGPGMGALTGLLAEKVERLILVEVEAALAEELKKRYASASNVTVIHGDILEIDLKSVLQPVGPETPQSLHVVSNLPYSISTDVCLKLFDSWADVATATLMLQREFAERLAAGPGGRDYGSITLRRELFCDVDSGFLVSPESFSPKPKVESRVIRLRFLPAPRLPAEMVAGFEKIVRKAFLKRRKTLLNAIEGTGDYTKPELAQILLALGIEAQRRPETLSFSEFAKLAAALPLNSH